VPSPELPRAPVKLTPEQARVREEMERRARMAKALGRIGHKIIVMSGKGGVGKTTVAVNLAASLARRGFKTGLLDMDLTGPDVPLMLGIEGGRFPPSVSLIVPYETKDPPLKVVSISFLLEGDTPVVWRGPLKAHALTQFLGDVAWGDLDFLVVDLPPGTSDEPLAVAENIVDADGVVIVTTPQAVSTLDVRKSVQFARLMKLRVLGVVENMSGFVCPHCGERTDLFGRGGGERLAADENVPFLGAIPLDPALLTAGDEGRPFVVSMPESPAAQSFEAAVDQLLMAVSAPAGRPA
jgi:ATP-binding protein involved in chromosome partitioning